jgi:hypothetical protein
MSRTLPRRLSAVFFLAFFVGSGIALPAADELLYHAGRDSAPAGVAHLDPVGGCGSHAEHCVLTSFRSVRPLASVSHQIPPVELAITGDVVFRPVSSLRSIDRSLLQPSRAPPVSAS